MPIIKSAKKRMKQNIVRAERNKSTRSQAKTYMKKVLTAVKEGKKEEAQKGLSMAYAMIDTATKKNILHPNTASRRKSLLARSVAGMK